MPSVVVADSSFLKREGLKSVIEKSGKYSQIGEIHSNNEFWDKLKSLCPDILVVDPEDGTIIDIDELDKVKKFSPGTRILVISGNRNNDNVHRIFKKGVLGYLTRECGEREIIDALDSLTKGEKFICSKIIDVILDDEKNKDGRLTEREIEIIKLITDKYSNQEIADKLFISINTVYTHRKNIMKKLQLKSPVELILYAIDSGIIQPYQN